MAVENIKTYTIPFTGYETGGAHGLRIVTFTGARPDFTADGYGSGTSHTLEEIFDYLRTSWGISTAAPVCSKDDAEKVFDAFGDISVYGQSATLTGDEPTIPGTDPWGYDKFSVKRSPIWENSESESPTVPYIFIRKRNNGALSTTISSYGSTSSGSYGAGRFDLGIVWVSDNFYYNSYNSSNSRRYYLERTGNTNFWHFSVANGGFFPQLLYTLYANGGLDDYEGTGTDPLGPGGTSGPGAGVGTFNYTSDTIGVPALPTLSAVDTGLVSLFAPTAGQAKALATYLWDTSVDWTNVRKVISNPIDTVMGFAIIPYTPDVGTPQTVKLGNMSTGVTMAPVTNQYKEIDCGTLHIETLTGTYMDFGGYTKIYIYLPYIGVVPIDTDDVMGKDLRIVYHCDCLSGACVVYVLSNGSQVATYNGQLSSNVPLTSNDFSNTVNGILGLAGNVGSLVASGGASAASSVPSVVSNAMNMLKPNVQKSGALAGTGGLMGTQFPFLIAQAPNISRPSDYASIHGYPSNICETLGNLRGFTQVEEVEFEGLTATEEEKDEIKELLKAGVVL